MTAHVLTTEAELGALYSTRVEASLIKEVLGLTAPYCAFVEAAPFFALATVAAERLDCAPRGDPAGFVRVLDDRTLAIPDGTATTESTVCATSSATPASP